MRAIKDFSSQDGNALMFNIHISSDPNATAIAFPDSGAQLPNAPARVLFEGSSTLTPFMRSSANDQHGLNLSDGARGFVLNGDRDAKKSEVARNREGRVAVYFHRSRLQLEPIAKPDGQSMKEVSIRI